MLEPILVEDVGADTGVAGVDVGADTGVAGEDVRGEIGVPGFDELRGWAVESESDDIDGDIDSEEPWTSEGLAMASRLSG